MGGFTILTTYDQRDDPILQASKLEDPFSKVIVSSCFPRLGEKTRYVSRVSALMHGTFFFLHGLKFKISPTLLINGSGHEETCWKGAIEVTLANLAMRFNGLLLNAPILEKDNMDKTPILGYNMWILKYPTICCHDFVSTVHSKIIDRYTLQ